MSATHGSVYVLTDPRYGDMIRYVGATTSVLAHRLSSHCSATRGSNRSNSPVSKWAAGLVEAGMRPGIRLVKEVLRDELNDAETAAIHEHLEEGWPLLNVSKTKAISIEAAERKLERIAVMNDPAATAALKKKIADAKEKGRLAEERARERAERDKQLYPEDPALYPAAIEMHLVEWMKTMPCTDLRDIDRAKVMLMALVTAGADQGVTYKQLMGGAGDSIYFHDRSPSVGKALWDAVRHRPAVASVRPGIGSAPAFEDLLANLFGGRAA